MKFVKHAHLHCIKIRTRVDHGFLKCKILKGAYFAFKHFKNIKLEFKKINYVD
jgi:hypothetical protein